MTASYSETGQGWFIRNAFDGVTVSTDTSKGFCYAGEDTLTITADLHEVRSFDRLTVYPAGDGNVCGARFPETIRVLISQDEENFTELMKASPERPTTEVPSFALGVTEAAVRADRNVRRTHRAAGSR